MYYDGCMFTFEQLQIAGMQPSLLANKIGLQPATLKRVFAKIKVRENGCWEWMASKRHGYGAINVKEYRKSIYDAHRLCYELVNGEQPRTSDIHHKVEQGCIGPSCCNPAHLEALDRKTHLTEFTPASVPYINLHKTHCSRGHEFTVENTHILPNGRSCRQCDRENHKAKREKDLVATGRKRYQRSPDKIKTHCKRSHELAGDNVRFVETNGKPNRRCRLCEALIMQKYYLKKTGRLDESNDPLAIPPDDGGAGE